MKIFHLSHDDIINAIAQFLLDTDQLNSNETEGTLYIETEKDGYKVIVDTQIDISKVH